MPKPTLVFAPGAGCPLTIFDPLITRLATQGYTSHTIAFPSIQQATSVKDLSADIQAVRTLVEAEIATGRDVIVIAHSWAGLPVSSALVGLEKSQTDAGKGGVIKLIFISAFLAAVGESVVSLVGGKPAEWQVRDETNGTVTVADGYSLFFHDVPDGEEWAEKLLPHAWATNVSPATGAAYLSIPTAYLLCEDDRAIPLAAQQMMVDKARANGACIRTETVKTGHMPWLVRTDWVAQYVVGEIEDAYA